MFWTVLNAAEKTFIKLPCNFLFFKTTNQTCSSQKSDILVSKSGRKDKGLCSTLPNALKKYLEKTALMQAWRGKIIFRVLHPL